jgi:hypothetical protein
MISRVIVSVALIPYAAIGYVVDIALVQYALVFISIVMGILLGFVYNTGFYPVSENLF